MGIESWSLTAKLCDYCKSSPASVFCRADTAFLCHGCDQSVHKAGSPHARVSVCQVCEQAPAVVSCKADAAALCATCDGDIHSANPLARRHERIPLVPFYENKIKEKPNYYSDEEAEAASWLLPTPHLNKAERVTIEESPKYNLLGEMDGVVPVQNKNNFAAVDGSNKPFFMYNFSSHSVCQSVSSSSLEVGVVPEPGTMAEVSDTPSRVLGIDREARVLRYREKRKNRKFEKTIRYASRKAYAETRPRIKGRFAKRNSDNQNLFVPTI